MFWGAEAKGITEGLIGSAGKLVKDAVSAFKADPTKLAELEASLEQAQLVYLAALDKAESERLTAVNATMQAEAKSEHWAQWLWRPCFGFTACAVLINNYILLPYFGALGIHPILVPGEVWGVITVVLGVSAWTRGTEKIEAVKKSS